MEAMASTTPRDRTVRLRWLTFGLVAALVLVGDQLSKLWVDQRFGLAWTGSPVAGYARPTPLVGDFVRIAKTYNDGGIFGLFGSSAPLLAAASLVVIGLIVWYQARTAGDGPMLLTLILGLLLGGALGNLIDRIRLGYVIDFVDMGIGSWRFYTFNVADSAISVAIAGLLLLGLFGERLGLVASGTAPSPPEGSRAREAADLPAGHSQVGPQG
jgi:signal peptidase II